MKRNKIQPQHRPEPQAASNKPQAASAKRQASSNKINWFKKKFDRDLK